MVQIEDKNLILVKSELRSIWVEAEMHFCECIMFTPIVFTFFRMMWNKTDDGLVPNQSESRKKYNRISVRFNKI